MGKTGDIIAIKFDDLPFGPIDRFELSLVNINLQRLRHSSYKHVFAKKRHRLAMQVVGQRLERFELRANNGCHRMLSHSPEKFLKVEGIEFERLLLGWDNNILDILPDRQQRASLEVIVAPICDKVFHHTASKGEHLHFIENDQTFPLMQLNPIVGGKIQEEGVEVIAVVAKILLHFFWGLKEVYFKARLVLVSPELSRKGALPHATRSLYKQRARSPGSLLPVTEPIIGFSLEHSRPITRSRTLYLLLCTMRRTLCGHICTMHRTLRL